MNNDVAKKSRKSRRPSIDARPTVLADIPADPEPTDEDLERISVKMGIKKVDTDPLNTRRNTLLYFWKDDLQKKLPDLFHVEFVDFIDIFPEGIINYQHYLDSNLWAEIWNDCLTRANHRCAGCGRKATQVHHRDYRPRVLRGEDRSPLVVLCRSCHSKVHAVRTKDSKSWEDCERELARMVNEYNAAIIASQLAKDNEDKKRPWRRTRAPGPVMSVTDKV